MPKVAKAPKLVPVPNELPEGVVLEKVEVTLESAKRDDDDKIVSGADRSVTVEIMVPARGSKVGILNFFKLHNERSGKDNASDFFTADAIREQVYKSVKAEILKRDKDKDGKAGIDAKDSASLIPSASRIRVYDRAADAAAKAADLIKSGKTPTMADFEAIFGKMA